MMQLTRQDAYALKCAISKQDIPAGTKLSPMLALLLQGLDYKDNPDHWALVQTLVAKNMEVLQQVMKEDPSQPPVAPETRTDGVRVPELPQSALLDATAADAAKTVGKFLDDGLAWIAKRSPMTPRLFLEAGLLWAVGLTVARRCVLRLDFDDIYPHQYALWVAPTTYFRKSTGLKAITHLVREVAPHLLLAAQSTPEALLSKLAGQKPSNYDLLPPFERKLEDEGTRYAGQRGIIIDEATKLLLSNKKYLDGLPEIIMELYDAPDKLERELRTDGKLVVYEPALSFLGATTPARLSRSLSDTEWEDGLMARFALLTPTDEEIKRQTTSPYGEDFDPPEALTKRLRAIHNAFEQPADYDVRRSGDKQSPLATKNASLAPEALDRFNAYADAMHAMTAPRAGLDERLRGNYGRFPVMMLKIALNLAVMDWADSEKTGSPPTVELGHIARAQQITETYRASAHRLLNAMNVSNDVKNEEKILDFIARSNGTPPSAREILRGTGIKTRKDVDGALAALMDAGTIEQAERKTGGRPAKVFRMAEVHA